MQSGFKHGLLSGGASTQNQGVRELRVVIRQFLLKPTPVFMDVSFVQVHKPGGEGLAGLAYQPVAAQPPQVFVDAYKTERPRPWRSELCQYRQCPRKELSSHRLKAPERRTAHAYAQRPECAALTIVG